MKNNVEKVVGVEAALDCDAVALDPIIDAAVVYLGWELHRVPRVVSQNRYHDDRAQWRATT